MAVVTVTEPPLGLSARFTFKEPFSHYLCTKLGVPAGGVLLTVSGINRLHHLIEAELRDPFKETYAPAGLSDEDYRHDLRNNTAVYVFSYHQRTKPLYVRCPLSMVQSYAATPDCTYMIKTLVLDLGRQPVTLDTTQISQELQALVYARLGITAQIKEVEVGEAYLMSSQEHEIRESIRQGNISVKKGSLVQLEELRHAYNQQCLRLQQLGISLA